MNSDDLLTADEVAEALGVSVDWVNSKKWSAPCEVTLKNRELRVRRRDLPRWHELAAAERVERREPPALSPDQVEFLQRAKAAAARLGTPSRWM